MKDLKRYALAGSLFFLSACSGGSCELEDRDTCGALGQRPCNFNGPGQTACDAGLTTENGEGKCVDDCGDVGERCCKSLGYGHDCGGENRCNATTLRCEAGPPPCLPGPHEYSFSCVRPDGCAVGVTMGLGTLSEATAKACLKGAFGCASLSDDDLKTYNYCYDNLGKKNNGGEFYAVSDPDAGRCLDAMSGKGATNVRLDKCAP